MILPEITKSQKQIIYQVYRFRFLSRIHIQIFLNHKNPSTIKLWLKDLTEKNYLNRIYSKKFNENTKPAIYYINTNGIRLIKTQQDLSKEQLQKLYHEKMRSIGFRIHCLTLADFTCNLLKHARVQYKNIKILTKTDYLSSDDEFNFLLQKLSPDAYYSFSGIGIASLGLIEIIDEYLPSFAIRKKLRLYIQNIQQGEWDTVSDEKFPSLLFILKTSKKLEILQRMIKRIRNEIDDEDLNTEFRCNLALISDIRTKNIAGPIWVNA